jgi:aspartate racemase
LFLFHQDNGSILGYQQLARLLGPDQPVYGVQPPARLWRTASQPRHIEELAGVYAQEIRSLQPRGPYHLGGLSAGGVFAYETARQLMEQGHEVALLALFDSLCPPYGEDTEEMFNMTTEAMRLRYHARLWLVLPPADKVRYLGRRLRRLPDYLLTCYKKARPGQQAAARVAAVSPKLTRSYLPPPYPGRVTYFWARHQQLCSVGIPDRRLGWRKVAVGGIDIHGVDGHHGAMLGEPVIVRRVAAMLRARIADAP